MKPPTIIRLLTLAAVTVCPLVPFSASQSEVRLPEVHYKRLLNDLQLAAASTSYLGQDMTIGLVLRYGSAFDPAGKAGLMHLLTRMLMRATLDKSAQDVRDELQYLGATIQIETNWDGVRVKLQAPSSRFERSLLILYQVVAEAVFLEEDFAEVRSQVLEDLAKPPDPRQSLRSQFEISLYSGMTYGRPLEGSPETLQNISVGDVRHFYNRYFSPSASTLVFAGAVDPEVVLQKATRIWGIWVRKDDIPFTFLPPRKPASRTIHLGDDAASPAAQFILGNLWPRREEPEYYAAGLAARILQERLTNILPTSLLTVGYEGRRMPGPFFVQGQAAADQALEEIRKILEAVESFHQNPASEADLQRARESWISDFRAQTTTPAGVCEIMMDAELYRLGTHYAANFAAILGRIQPGMVQSAAKDSIFPGGVMIVVHGPAAALREGLQALGTVHDMSGPQ